MNPLSILLRTYEYRGDHSSDICIAYEAKEHETVEELVKRLNPENQDVIEIRTCKVTP